MKTLKAPLIIISIVSLILISNLSSIEQNNRNNLVIDSSISATGTQASLTCDTTNCTVFDTVNVTLNLNDFKSSDSYQVCLKYDEQSNNSIASSSKIHGGSPISEICSFNLSNYNLNVSNGGNYYYFCLICNNCTFITSTSVFVTKSILKCLLNQNNTIIEYGDKINAHCTFISVDNLHYLNNTLVYYKILNNGIVIKDDNSIQTDSDGVMNLTFNTSAFQMIGNYSIYIFGNESKYFMKFHFFYNFIVTPLKLYIKVQDNTPKFELVDNNNQSNLMYPIYIETNLLNGSLFYNPEVNLSILYNYSDCNDFLDLKNGSYYCTMKLNNTSQNVNISIIDDSKLYSITNPNLTLNITKRSIDFNKMFSENQNFSEYKDISFYFEITDINNDSYILGLNNLIIIQYFFNNKWNTLNNIPISKDQLYLFNISKDTLKFLDNKIDGPIYFRFCFNGNSLYDTKNSSVFSITFNINNESNSNLSNHPNSFQNTLKKILLISGLSSIPFISFPIVKLINKKIKKKYVFSNLTI